MLTRKVLLLIAAFALVAVACGDSATDTTTPPAEEPAAEEPAAEEPAAEEPAAEEPAAEEPMAEVLTGIGVDPETMTISLGLLADLTGIFAPLVIDIVDAQTVYWDLVNEAGGIGGEWKVEILVEDTNYNVEQHGEKYEALRDKVVAFTQSTGSPTTVSILDKIKEDKVLVIPLSWYSGWPIDSFDGGYVLEQGTNYCIEAMNAMDFIKRQGGQTVAIATFPGDYGQDAAIGVKIAAELLGMEIVYDGEGAVIPGQDQTPVIAGIVESGADWVWVTTNPSIFAELLGGAFGAGYTGMWTGSSPSYNSVLLDSPVGPLIDQVFYQSTYNLPWDADNAAVQEMRAAMAAAHPDRRPSDAFLIGWNEAKVMEQILEEALASLDLRREGVVAAAHGLDVIDLGGAAPDQRYGGTSNENVVRATVILKPDLELYTAAGGAEQTLTQADGTTGSVLVEDFFISDIARDYDFVAPCYEL